MDFGIAGCGFEIHDLTDIEGNIELRLGPAPSIDNDVSTPLKSIAMLHERYPGFPTTDLGPLVENLEQMEEVGRKVSLLLQPSRITALKSWKDPLQSTFFHATVEFFRQGMGYDYALVPLTTECISSPMGLGSDSLPVEVSLHVSPTYLADSMQFTREYNLRVNKSTKRTYYISASFRGEDPDSTHMNQLYHVECELHGDIDDGMAVIERYVIAVAKEMLSSHSGLIASIAGDTAHIEDLLNRFLEPNARMPRIALDDAIELCRDVPDTFENELLDIPGKGRKLTRKGEAILIDKRLENEGNMRVDLPEAYVYFIVTRTVYIIIGLR